MRKTLLVLCASLVASLTIDAQTLIPVQNRTYKEASVLRTTVPSRIALEEGEKIMGFYTTDDLPQVEKAAIAFRENGDYEVGTMFPLDVIGSFATGQITKIRYAIADPYGPATISIFEVNDQKQITEVYKSESFETKTGWNDVTVTKPVTIKENTCYVVTYTVKQNSDKQASILTDTGVNPDGGVENGLLVRNGDSFYPQDKAMGNLAVQAVVKGGKFIDYDLTISNIRTSSYVQKGSTMNFSFNLQNRGNKLPENYELAVTLDGKPINAQITKPGSLAKKQDVKGSFTLAEGIEGISHKLEVAVATINGNKPTENINDDVVSADFRTYSKAMDRQMTVIEQLTSQYCGACPTGTKIMSDVCATRSDIAIVAIHQDMGYNARDVFTIEAGNYMAYPISSGFLPSIAINRFYIDDPVVNPYSTIGIHPLVNKPSAPDNFEDAAKNLNMLIDEVKQNGIPAFADINISTVYDESANKLNITVSGNATDEAKELYGENTTLTVVLTEDNVKAKQANGQQWDNNYIHNNVLRATATSDPAGEAINWTGDTSYSNTFSVKVGKDWNLDNMNVVAYITPSFNKIQDIKGLAVSNANKAAIDHTSGISQSIADKKDVTEVARFTIDGRQIIEPVKGINIVKMSDGTTVKELVK